MIGSSGSGKTTLLRALNGSLRCEWESLYVAGMELAPGRRRNRDARRRVGQVFQEFHLVEQATVWHNVLWGRLGALSTLEGLLGRFGDYDRQRTAQAIQEVGLAELAHRRVDRLSGGQKQRVGIARVLAQGADLVLADEPVSNLDPSLAGEILELLTTLAREHGCTLLMSLHRPDLAMQHSDRVVGLRDGRMVLDRSAPELSSDDLERVYGPRDMDPDSDAEPADAKTREAGR